MNRESTSFRGRAERSFRYRNLAILAALPMLLSVLPGCEVVLFYYLLEQDDNAWSSVGEVSCDREGLRADGDLVIPILQPQDTQKTEEICSWWQLDFNDDSYRACCSGDCCEWGVGAWGTDPEDLSGDGEWCRWSGMCEVGLSCFPLPPGQDDGCPDGEAPGPNGCEPAAEALESGECRLSRLGEDCDGQHACEEPMYCSGSTMTGQCRLHVAVEGEGCLPAEVEPCLAPMQCTCQNKKECRCWDGSKGDPCEEGSCQVGLSCIAAAGDGTGKTICVEGKKGDPCKTGTCKAGLACMPTGGAGGTVAYLCVAGEFGDPCYDSSGCEPGMECIDVQLGGVGNCGIVLGQNAPCAPGSAFQICGSGMVCNTALPTPTCQPPGGEGG
ncbi:MAG: hypothetical protein FJ109_21860, partial [Deltaproteobacteria bacterium]|nr:hypothetical protein [Deltaproteobacteria bacterium]